MMAGNPNWWSINSMHPQSQQHESSPQYLYGSSPLSSTPLDDDPHHGHHHHPTQEYPRSWSQLLIGGLANDPEEMLAGSPNYEYKKLDHQSWEGQIITNPCLRAGVNNINNNNCGDHVKLESSLLYEGSVAEDEFQVARPSASNWSQIIMPNSSPSSSTVTSLLNFSSNNNSSCMLERRNIQNPADTSSECNSSKAVSVAKKPKIQHSTTQTSLKVRKEKLGDRITALHQLVSPFGKTDTASVLSESVGYIRFLQAQIQALSSPYLANVASRSMGHQQSFDTEDRPKNLRSRGLCLVPVSCTVHVASDNGADYWAPPPGRGF